MNERPLVEPADTLTPGKPAGRGMSDRPTIVQVWTMDRTGKLVARWAREALERPEPTELGSAT
jgi:hypothetical protein